MHDLAVGPGWVIDGATLTPRIVDLTEFRRGVADDPCADVLEALWSGRPDHAKELLVGREPTLRVRALLADCRRERGDLAGALDDYSSLVSECAGTAWEAVMRQHLGKVLFAGGRLGEAAEQFTRALDLRERTGADEALVVSSRHALEVTQRLLAGR